MFNSFWHKYFGYNTPLIYAKTLNRCSDNFYVILIWNGTIYRQFGYTSVVGQFFLYFINRLIKLIFILKLCYKFIVFFVCLNIFIINITKLYNIYIITIIIIFNGWNKKLFNHIQLRFILYVLKTQILTKMIFYL